MWCLCILYESFMPIIIKSSSTLRGGNQSKKKRGGGTTTHRVKGRCTERLVKHPANNDKRHVTKIHVYKQYVFCKYIAAVVKNTAICRTDKKKERQVSAKSPARRCQHSAHALLKLRGPQMKMIAYKRERGMIASYIYQGKKKRGEKKGSGVSLDLSRHHKTVASGMRRMTRWDRC